MNSWWNLHVFSLRPRQRERRQPVPVTSRASQRSGCSLSAGSAHKWPGPGHPPARPGEGWKNQLGGSGWVIHWGVWYDMYVSTYDIYIYIYIYIYICMYIYIQIWNGSYLYMSSCHVDNAMVITTKSCQQPGSMNGKRPFYMVESCSTNIFDDRRLQRILGHVSQEITLKKIPSNSIPLIPCYILSIIPMMSV